MRPQRLQRARDAREVHRESPKWRSKPASADALMVRRRQFHSILAAECVLQTFLSFTLGRTRLFP